MHLEHDPATPASPEIGFDDFLKVDVRLGTVLAAQPLEGARKPALELTIDFGPAVGVKRSSAQIVSLYTAEQLVGRQVAAVVNLPPKQIGKFVSEALVLGVPVESGGVALLAADRDAPNGARLC
ncbi:Methionine--tRNA ligase [Pseudobythopirellula maris]|uniref:Methionine--tRNA ligase n=1 Tax=Pseudobythopirellula maris TaxID=2527991 RepID=A0A5C5ZFL8_9BACT|nr:tRNA-binding protein [Pseudobythopirellula maris]TWT86174.1 Methionine--tRNA ligase [Pseudobythopirellula maris]